MLQSNDVIAGVLYEYCSQTLIAVFNRLRTVFSAGVYISGPVKLVISSVLVVEVIGFCMDLRAIA